MALSESHPLPAHVFVIGAGISGLSAATRLARRGAPVTVYEAAGQAGGRCRSYYDAALDQTIDNGNHLVLSGNRGVIGYLKRIGAESRLSGPRRAIFPFADLKTGSRWALRLNAGPFPWWTLSRRRRVPGTVAADYFPYARLMFAGRNVSIGEALPMKGPLWERLMRPFLLAALNTEPELASARLAGQVLRETLAKGGWACRPRVAAPGLSAAFVDPALDYLKKQGVGILLGRRLRNLVTDDRQILALEFSDATVPLHANDMVVLAVPPWMAKEILPAITVPGEFRAIVNGHFRVAPPAGTPPILGVVGGTVEWMFSFKDRISVTVSAADSLAEREREELARILWRDVMAVLRLSSELPPWQIVKERRATFAATPVQDLKRPKAATQWRNLFLAGDWTDTGLPATLEGAVRSGETAARLALRRLLR
ncbi:MAG: hydroxysqualene dehydroxylase HpnE [Rhizomicrobium sp.]